MAGVVADPAFFLDQMGDPRRRPQAALVAQRLRPSLEAAFDSPPSQPKIRRGRGFRLKSAIRICQIKDLSSKSVAFSYRNRNVPRLPWQAGSPFLDERQ